MRDLGLTPRGFWELTPREFLLMAEHRERMESNHWKRVRWLASIIVNINRPKGRPAITPEKLLPLVSDRGTGEKAPSQDRLVELKKRFGATIPARNVQTKGTHDGK